MESKFENILEDLKKSIESLKGEGISISKLDDSYEELLKHTGEILKVEENIDAIKSQVVGGIMSELDKNKKVGKFSIWGFWIGAIALILSIVVSISNFRINPLETENKISLINERIENLSFRILGVDGNYKHMKNVIFIEENLFSEPIPILFDYNSKDTISIELSNVTEDEIEGKFMASVYVKLYINGRRIGLSGLEKIINVNNSKSFDFNNSTGDLRFVINDSVQISNQTFLIKKIFNKESRFKEVSDEIDGVLIEKL